MLNYYHYNGLWLCSKDEYPYEHVSEEQALQQADSLIYLYKGTEGDTMSSHKPFGCGQLEKEGIDWIASAPEAAEGFSDAFCEFLCSKGIRALNTAYEGWEERLHPVCGGKKRLHLLALGDVGSTLLIGLRLLGGDVLSSIGIFDVRPEVCRRWEYELNQIAYPWDYDAMPIVDIVTPETMFDCDVFVFCASRGVPAIGQEQKDVRMVQYEANRELVAIYAKQARNCGFKGLFAVVSDPVDQLCRAAFEESNKNDAGEYDWKGLLPEQVEGYGLGVMNARAAFYAARDEKFTSFLTEGRAYGPHGKDLVIANSIDNYNDELSRELTKLAVEANLRTRETGYKPYVAPALSSGAISILLTLRGEWHYSASFLGGVYLGCRSRRTPLGIEREANDLPETLTKRIETAYTNLKSFIK